jgi:predicted nucleotidyltransferase component of viral defense system
MPLKELLREIIEKLESQNFPYMVSGSLALSAYILPRMTRDIDVIIELEDKMVDAFIKLFDQNFYLHEPSIVEEVRRKGMFNVIDHRSGYKVDFVVRKDIEFRKVEFSRKRKMMVMGIYMSVVSVEDLILSKLIWIQQVQSQKQMEDISGLLRDASPDLHYLKEWITKLNIDTFGLL